MFYDWGPQIEAQIEEYFFSANWWATNQANSSFWAFPCQVLSRRIFKRLLLLKFAQILDFMIVRSKPMWRLFWRFQRRNNCEMLMPCWFPSKQIARVQTINTEFSLGCLNPKRKYLTFQRNQRNIDVLQVRKKRRATEFTFERANIIENSFHN